MRVRDYTEALYTLIQEGNGDAKLLERLKKVLEKRGHMTLYPKILRDLLIKLKYRENDDIARITVARESDLKKYAAAIESTLEEIGAKKHATHIDHTIIGGFITEGGGKRIDKSQKRSLLALYHSLIA